MSVYAGFSSRIAITTFIQRQAFAHPTMFYCATLSQTGCFPGPAHFDCS
jgi:hypothetical protein